MDDIKRVRRRQHRKTKKAKKANKFKQYLRSIKDLEQKYRTEQEARNSSQVQDKEELNKGFNLSSFNGSNQQNTKSSAKQLIFNRTAWGFNK